MQKLTTYIEYLLMTQHYCHVPGHGAYMLVDEPAKLDTLPGIASGSRRVYTLSAPRRSVHFSTLHTHNDGMLAALLMEAEGMTFDEANRYIERQAALIPEDFAETALHHTDTDNFGHEELSIELWADIEARQLEAQRQASGETHDEVASATLAPTGDTITIPKAWLQRAAAVVLIAIFFFTNFIGLNQNQGQLASVIDANLLQFTCNYAGIDLDDDATVSDAVIDLNDEAIAQSEDPDETEDTQTETETTLMDEAADLAANEAAETVAQQGPTYYIIISSTRREVDALSICERYHQQGFGRVGVVASANGKLWRVYTAATQDKTEAIRLLRQTQKQNPRLSKSWMLTVDDDQSLSYIIKDIYNDNQLSMELSHPNTRTERDQG